MVCQESTMFMMNTGGSRQISLLKAKNKVVNEKAAAENKDCWEMQCGGLCLFTCLLALTRWAVPRLRFTDGLPPSPAMHTTCSLR
jgi:hypothetical protein